MSFFACRRTGKFNCCRNLYHYLSYTLVCRDSNSFKLASYSLTPRLTCIKLECVEESGIFILYNLHCLMSLLTKLLPPCQEVQRLLTLKYLERRFEGGLGECFLKYSKISLKWRWYCLIKSCFFYEVGIWLLILAVLSKYCTEIMCVSHRGFGGWVAI